jgi:hypothetical protein
MCHEVEEQIFFPVPIPHTEETMEKCYGFKATYLVHSMENITARCVYINSKNVYTTTFPLNL